MVCEVKKGSPAHRAGSLLPGDRLLAVNGTPLEQCSAEHIAHILQQGEELISLRVERLEHPPGKGGRTLAVAAARLFSRRTQHTVFNRSGGFLVAAASLSLKTLMLHILRLN